MILRQPNRKRSGATTVEFMFVAILLFMLLFGILEYQIVKRLWPVPVVAPAGTASKAKAKG